MQCPVCKTRNFAELNAEVDGFSADLNSCDQCGAAWTHSYKQNKPVLINFGSSRGTTIL